MSEPLRLAIVGCGDVGGYTATFARLNRGIRLAACCDRDEERAQRFARRHRIERVYTGYEEMLTAGGLDAIYLATPHDLHLPQAQAAMRAGLAVFLEKPLANTYENGVALAAEAGQHGARLAVNYQNRYDPGCYALARAVQAGAVGKVRYARLNVPWLRELGYFTSAAGWHMSKQRSGGGTLLTQASHFLDVLLWACDSPALRAQGLARNVQFADRGVEVEDLAMGQVELQNGAILQVCSSMIAFPQQPHTIEVYGEKGTLRYTAGARPKLDALGVKIKREKVPVPGLHALGRSLEAFRRYAQGGEPHLVTADEALATLAAVDALYRAAESGGWEAVKK